MLQVSINALIAASIYALISLGFGLIYSTTKFFHFAHGAVYAWGAYAAFAWIRLWGGSWAAGCVFGIIVSVALGLAIELAIYRPIRGKGGESLVLLLAGLGMYVVLQNLLSLLFGDSNKTLRLWQVKEGFAIGSARITGIQIIIVCTAITCLIITAIVLRWSVIGCRLRAVANDPELAEAQGVRVNRFILLVFGLGSALAGGAAILISLDVDMTPDMGFSGLMMAVAASIIGGIGSVAGVAMGSLIIAFAQNLAAWWLPSQWKEPAALAVLLLFLLFRPQGIFGRHLWKAQL